MRRQGPDVMQPTRHMNAKLRSAVATGAVGAVLALAVVMGCSVTKGNYKTLSFFFDGVPDPALTDGTVSRVEGGQVVSMSLHRPYAEEKCEACHRTRYRPTRNDSSICLPCHAPVKGEHSHMHGAVVADACLWCHNPHESSRTFLLRDVDRKVCGQCHTTAMLNSTRVPEHADASRGCLECHSGHGGSTSFMLRAGVRGAPQPGASPEGS